MTQAGSREQLGSKAISGGRWTVAASIAGQVFQFALGIVLMRLLGPEPYGLLGMAMAFFGLATVFADYGLAAALVQAKALSPVQVDSVFAVGVVISLTMVAILGVLAVPISEFFGHGELRSLVRVLALTFLLRGIVAVPRALLQRELRFKEIAGIDLSAGLIGGITGLLLAVSGTGVWALVLQLLTTQALCVVLTFRVARWLPRLEFEFEAIRPLFRFGVGLFGFSFLNYWARNLDDILIGRMLGDQSLGAYQRAYSLMLFPIRQVINVLSQVMFPTLANMQDDHARLRSAYVRALRLITFVVFPAMTGLWSVATLLLPALLGDRWASIVPIVEVLCLVGIVQALMNPVGWIYQSVGRTDLLFKWGLFACPVVIVSIVVGATFGSLEAIAVSYAMANAILLIPALVIPCRLVELPVMELFKAVAGNLFFSVLMAMLVVGVREFALGKLDPWASCSLLVFLGIAAYLCIALSAKSQALSDLLIVLKGKR